MRSDASELFPTSFLAFPARRPASSVVRPRGQKVPPSAGQGHSSPDLLCCGTGPPCSRVHSQIACRNCLPARGREIAHGHPSHDATTPVYLDRIPRPRGDRGGRPLCRDARMAPLVATRAGCEKREECFLRTQRAESISKVAC